MGVSAKSSQSTRHSIVFQLGFPSSLFFPQSLICLPMDALPFSSTALFFSRSCPTFSVSMATTATGIAASESSIAIVTYGPGLIGLTTKVYTTSSSSAI